MTAPLERKTCGGGKKKWFNAHILWIVGGLWSDLRFNCKICRWWLFVFSLLDLVFWGGLMVYAYFVVVLGVVGGGW